MTTPDPKELIRQARELCSEIPATSIDRSERVFTILPQLADALEEALTDIARKEYLEEERRKESWKVADERDEARAELQRLREQMTPGTYDQDPDCGPMS